MNLPPSQSSQISLFRENIKCLKELYISKATQQVINQSIWSFKTKLPIQYEEAILVFCQASFGSKNIANSMPMRAVSIFKDLECKFSLEKKIQQFQYFQKIESELSKGQIGALRYNLACFYQMFGMDAKALKTITDGSKIPSSSYLYAKLLLKLKCYKESSKGSIESEILKRFYYISNPCFCLQQFLKEAQSCQIFELYNIGLNLKLIRKYELALALFEKVSSETEMDTQTWVLSNINIAQCYFELNKITKAIKILNTLIETTNFYLQPYKMEIKMKLNYWQKFSESSGAIKALQQINNYRSNNYSKNKLLEGKSLLKDRKLLFVEQKLDELNKLSKKGSTIISKRGHKNCYSLLPYQNTGVSRTFSSMEKVSKSRKPKKQRQNVWEETQRQNNLLRPNIKMRKNSQIISINSFLNSYNSVKGSKSSERQVNLDDGQNKNLIDHYWSVIKNSQNQAQIAESYMNLGDAYNNDNDFENALEAYKVAFDKGRLQASNRIGNLYYYKENISLAAEYFEKYLKSVNEFDHQTRIKLLHCYSKNPDCFRKATQCLHKMLQANPNDVEAHILSVTIYMKQNHQQKAVEMCESFKQANMMCAQNHHLLGLIYKSMGHTKRSYNCFISALRVSPTNINSLIEITELAEVQDFYLDLIEIYKKALSKNYKNHELFQILHSLINKKQIKFDEISPTLSFSELVAVGDFFIEKQLYAEAEYAYRQASQYTNNTLLKEKLGNLEYFKNNFERAEQYFRESQKRKPAFKIQVKIGNTLLKQRKYKQAQGIFEECVSKQNESKSICLNMMGQCEFGLGNFEKALQKFQMSSSLGYNRKINTAWESACRRQIMNDMKKTTLK